MDKTKFLISLVILALVSFYACEIENGEYEIKISKHGDDESHEDGENCMRCHYTEGEGEGWFTTAGTILVEDGNGDDKGFANFKDMEVWITTLPKGQGEVLQKIEVDDKGNFFTTEAIDYTKPRYAVIKMSGEMEEMDDAINHGQCNLCHGVNEEAIKF